VYGRYIGKLMIIICKAMVVNHVINKARTAVSIEYRLLPYNGADLRYDTIEEFNVDSKSKKNVKEETKTNKDSAPLIQYRFRSVKAVRKEIRVTMEESICERDEF